MFPPVDGGVTYLPPLDRGLEAIVAFTGHAVVASRLSAVDVADLRPDGYGRAMAPELVLRLAGSGFIDDIDALLVARGTGDGRLPATNRWEGHPRIAFARKLRSNVMVHGDDRGFVTLADGLAGRREMSIEIDEAWHGSGSGRELIAEGLALAAPGEFVFAAVSPGNARSLRAFLSVGFVPLASQVIMIPA